MRVYHRTLSVSARHILATGFRDGEDTYMTNRVFRGVWVSTEPLDENSGAFGEVMLSMEIADDVFCEYEWTEDDKAYRESLIPAEILNRFGRPTMVETETDPALAW
jgi:hypothetical protein